MAFWLLLTGIVPLEMFVKDQVMKRCLAMNSRAPLGVSGDRMINVLSHVVEVCSTIFIKLLHWSILFYLQVFVLKL